MFERSWIALLAVETAICSEVFVYKQAGVNIRMVTFTFSVEENAQKSQNPKLISQVLNIAILCRSLFILFTYEIRISSHILHTQRNTTFSSSVCSVFTTHYTPHKTNVCLCDV